MTRTLTLLAIDAVFDETGNSPSLYGFRAVAESLHQSDGPNRQMVSCRATTSGRGNIDQSVLQRIVELGEPPQTLLANSERDLIVKFHTFWKGLPESDRLYVIPLTGHWYVQELMRRGLGGIPMRDGDFLCTSTLRTLGVIQEEEYPEHPRSDDPQGDPIFDPLLRHIEFYKRRLS